MRLAYYAGASTAAAAACLLKAFHQRPNFYSATVYLSESNACLLILTNLLLVMACAFMYALQRLLYGPLRPIEIEQLSEKAWYAVLDTLLAMPSFREDVGGWLLTMFVLLLAGKVWGWIGEGRVDVLEQQPPANPRLFHARLTTSLFLSVVFDYLMFRYCVETVVADPRPGMMVIFTFEFAILFVFSTFTLARYALSVVETAIVQKQTKQAIETRKLEIRAERAAQREGAAADGSGAPAIPTDDDPIDVDENEVDVPGFEGKRRFLFGLELCTDFIKLMIYVCFLTVSITFNGLPIHIMRDVYMTFVSFSKRVADYVAYRKATSGMNSRYPDATTEEIRGDACIVCRESMVAWAQPNAGGDAQPAGEQPAAAPGPTRRRDEGLRAKKLPCGHILHLRCLKAWLERQQVCPTCRRPVITAVPTENRAAPGGENPPGQRPPGQQPQQPRARARMFNLGPLRVGLVNAPNNQMQNILNQLQNPDAQNQNGVNQQAPNQQGPNHLGLQVPYANQGAGGVPATSILAGPRAAVPLSIQLMQTEQRIMVEAHNLGIEQEQLGNLRRMEAELGRLRALRLPTHQVVGTNGLPRQAHQPLQQPAMPVQQNGIHDPILEQLHGNPTQRLESGNSALPEGLVLPEGWSLMPLRRLDRPQDPTPSHSHAIPAPPVAPEDPFVDAVAPIRPITATAGPSTPPAQSAQEASQPAGPRDDQGSPLFVPTQLPSVRNAPPVTPPPPANQETPTDTVPDQGPSQSESKPTWGGDNWSFVDQPSTEKPAEPPSEAAPTQPSSTNGHPPEKPTEGQNYTGKGKGRAVEVEDVPDADSGT